MCDDEDLLRCCREVSGQLAADLFSWKSGGSKSVLFARSLPNGGPGTTRGVLRKSTDTMSANAVNDTIRKNASRAQERFIIQAVPQLRMLFETEGEGTVGVMGRVGFLFTASPCPLRTSLGVTSPPIPTPSALSRGASVATHSADLDSLRPGWNASTLMDPSKQRSGSARSRGVSADIRSHSTNTTATAGGAPIYSPPASTDVTLHHHHHHRSASAGHRPIPAPQTHRPPTSGLNQSLALDISVDRSAIGHQLLDEKGRRSRSSVSDVPSTNATTTTDTKGHFLAFLSTKGIVRPQINVKGVGGGPENGAEGGGDCESKCRYHLRLLNLAVPSLSDEINLSVLQSPIRNGELLCVLLNAAIMGLRSVAKDASSVDNGVDGVDVDKCRNLLDTLHPVSHRRLMAGRSSGSNNVPPTVRARIENVCSEVVSTLKALCTLFPQVQPLIQAYRTAIGGSGQTRGSKGSGLVGVVDGHLQCLWEIMYVLCRVFFQHGDDPTNTTSTSSRRSRGWMHSRDALGELDRSVGDDTNRIVTRSASSQQQPQPQPNPAALSPTKQWAFHRRHGDSSSSMQASPMQAYRTHSTLTNTTTNSLPSWYNTDDSKRLDYAVSQFLLELQILPELGSIDSDRGRNKAAPLVASQHRMKVMQSQFVAAMDDPTKAPYVPESMTYRAVVRAASTRGASVDGGQGRMTFTPRVSDLTTIMSPTVFPYIRNGTILYDAAMKITGDYTPEESLRGPGTLAGRSAPTTFTRNPKLRRACESNIELAQLLLLKHANDSDPPLGTHCLTDPTPIYNGDFPFILSLLEDMMRYAFKVRPKDGHGNSREPPFIPEAYRLEQQEEMMLGGDGGYDLRSRSVPMGPSDGVPFPPHGEGFATNTVHNVPHSYLTGLSGGGYGGGGGVPSTHESVQHFEVNQQFTRQTDHRTAYLRPPAPQDGWGSAPQPTPHTTVPQPHSLNARKMSMVTFGGITTQGGGGGEEDEVDGDDGKSESNVPLSRRSSTLHLEYLTDVAISDRECLLLGGWLLRKLKPAFRHSPPDGSFSVDFTNLTSEVDALAPVYEAVNRAAAQHNNGADGPSPPKARFLVLSDGVVLFRLMQVLVSSSDSNALSSGVQLKPKTDAAKKQNIRKVVAFMKEKLKILGGCISIEDALFQGDARAVVLVLRSLKNRFKHHT